MFPPFALPNVWGVGQASTNLLFPFVSACPPDHLWSDHRELLTSPRTPIYARGLDRLQPRPITRDHLLFIHTRMGGRSAQPRCKLVQAIAYLLNRPASQRLSCDLSPLNPPIVIARQVPLPPCECLVRGGEGRLHSHSVPIEQDRHATRLSNSGIPWFVPRQLYSSLYMGTCTHRCCGGANGASLSMVMRNREIFSIPPLSAGFREAVASEKRRVADSLTFLLLVKMNVSYKQVLSRFKVSSQLQSRFSILLFFLFCYFLQVNARLRLVAKHVPYLQVTSTSKLDCATV
ncbi:hypothetical protein F5144DRAFT_77635 [Chaetomium tenue]|uniref:Uncharacterized protein n=1 Tax=Chaetomium tenue TaxID=1854479 RepID=A0ACB7PSG6_9PEZI|nr:hypothetical protein F5144DRAFT_77635 [Chaetomium globosum]